MGSFVIYLMHIFVSRLPPAVRAVAVVVLMRFFTEKTFFRAATGGFILNFKCAIHLLKKQVSRSGSSSALRRVDYGGLL